MSVGIKCVSCRSDDLIVIDSRSSKGVIRRRRECNKCKTRMTTHETIVGQKRTDYRVNHKLFIKGMNRLRERVAFLEAYIDSFIDGVRLGDLEFLENGSPMDWTNIDFNTCQQSKENVINFKKRKVA